MADRSNQASVFDELEAAAKGLLLVSEADAGNEMRRLFNECKDAFQERDEVQIEAFERATS